VIPAFLAVTIPLVLTPGASTAVVLRNSLAGGTRAGVQTAIGTNSASICYGVLTAFGFAVALRRWPSAWETLQILGAMYLGWLAVQSFRRAASGDAPIVTPALSAEDARPGAFARNASQGFFTNGLNPSVAAYYVVIVPQFVPAGAPVVRTTLLLTAIHVGLAATWHVTWAAAGGTLAHVFARRRPRQVLDVLVGVTLAALAISLARR
jgi:threonine/homoserine/homoserine lactone efflux protein